MSDLPPKGTPSLVIIISDSLIVASRILRLAVSFYSVYQTQSLLFPHCSPDGKRLINARELFALSGFVTRSLASSL